MLQGPMKWKLRSGGTILFWLDKWLTDCPLLEFAGGGVPTCTCGS